MGWLSVVGCGDFRLSYSSVGLRPWKNAKL